MDSITSWLVWLILPYILFNLFVVGVIIYSRMAADAVKNWPSVPGTIVSSRLARSHSYDTGSAPFAFVNYKYEVGGKAYKSVTVAPGGAVNDEEVAKAIVARYPARADATVYYNPKNPANAFLEKNSTAQQSLFWRILIGGNAVLWIIMLLARGLTTLFGVKW